MELSQILRKLQPLMPKQVNHWLRMLDTAQPEAKALIERQIWYTAHKVLGDFRNKILLSLPPEKKAKGCFHLGTVLYEKEKWPVGLQTKELMQNLAIFGRSGAGKTNVAFHVLKQLSDKGIRFLFLDWKRTARHLLPVLGNRIKVYTPVRSLSPFPFNPFLVPPGCEQQVYLNHLIDVMGDAYTLGDGAKSVLQKCISAAFRNSKAPTVDDVLGEISKMQTKGRAGGWKISARRALESVELLDSKMNSSEQEKFAKSLLKQNTVVGKFSGQEAGEREAGFPVDKQRSPFGATVLEEGCWLLLHDIVQHPDDGVDQRYKRLGASVRVGNRWKSQLLGNGLVASERVKVGKTFRILLKPTEIARKFLLSSKGVDGQASLLHEYWKNWYAQKFAEKGYHIILECPRTAIGNSGRMDVLAWRVLESVETVALDIETEKSDAVSNVKGVETIAIEIETGKSDTVSNVKRDLREEVRKVLVVAVDEGALKKVERQLAEVGLLIIGRVEVVLRYEFPILYQKTTKLK